MDSCLWATRFAASPIYGQGMTAATREVCLLHGLLADRASRSDPLRGLGRVFLAEAASLVETPWTIAEISNFAFPETSGHRPSDLKSLREYFGTLSRIAARDEAVQQLMVAVSDMLKPLSALRTPDLVRRVRAEVVCVS
jgi:hypothetical protein